MFPHDPVWYLANLRSELRARAVASGVADAHADVLIDNHEDELKRWCGRKPARDEAEYRQRAGKILRDRVKDYRRAGGRTESESFVLPGHEGTEGRSIEVPDPSAEDPQQAAQDNDLLRSVREALARILHPRHPQYQNRRGRWQRRYDRCLVWLWMRHPDTAVLRFGRILSWYFTRYYSKRCELGKLQHRHACRRMKEILELLHKELD